MMQGVGVHEDDVDEDDDDDVVLVIHLEIKFHHNEGVLEQQEILGQDYDHL